MTKRRRSSSQRLTSKAFELSVAAPYVAIQRASRIAAAGLSPSRRDRREFILMGAEKAQVFYQSWMAMWATAAQLPLQLAQAGIASPAIWTGRARLSAGRQAIRSNDALAKVLAAGIAPVHSKAVANAKRLARRKRGRCLTPR